MKLALFALAALTVLGSSAALAKDATCYTTDDGEYPCWFESTAGDGSFQISASGYPTFMVNMESAGVAWVHAEFHDGGGSVALPGPYYRSEDDGACWVNPDTTAEICAW